MKTKNPNKLAFNAFGCATYFLVGVYFAANQTLSDSISRAFGQSTTGQGIMLGLMFFGMVASSLATGELSERIGRKNAVNLGFLLMTAGVFLFALTNSYAIACVGLFLSGMGQGSLEGMIGSAAADVNGEQSTRAMNVMQAFFSIGAVVSPFAIGLFAQGDNAWRTIFWIVGAFSVILLFFSFSLSYGARPAQQEIKQGVVTFSLFKKPIFICYLLMILFYVGSETGLCFWVVRYFGQMPDMASLGKISLSVFWLATIVTRLAAAKVKNHRLLMVVSFACSALGTAAFVFMPTGGLKIAAFAFVALSMGPVWPTLFGLGAQQHPNASGAAFGVMMVFSSLGGTLIQPAIGAIVEHAPVSTAYWLIAAVCAAMALLMLFTFRAEKRQAKA